MVPGTLVFPLSETGMSGNWDCLEQGTKYSALCCTGHDQEGRRGLNEVVPGTLVFPLSETGVLGDFWALSRLCAELELRRSGSSLGPSQ